MKKIFSILYFTLLGVFIAGAIGINPAYGLVLSVFAHFAGSFVKHPGHALFTGIMSKKDLSKAAASLSNFNGKGAGDIGLYLDYDGSGSNQLSQRQFTFKVTNTNATEEREFVIIPGYLKGNLTELPGQIVNGAFLDVNGDAGLSAISGRRQSIENFMQFILFNPTRVLNARISSTQEGQISKNFLYQRISPWEDLPSKELVPSTFTDQNSQRGNVATIPFDVQFDRQSIVKYVAVPNSVTDITFYFGASHNDVAALEKLKQMQQMAANRSEIMQNITVNGG